MANLRQRRRQRRVKVKANRSLGAARPRAPTAANLNSGVQPMSQRTARPPRVRQAAIHPQMSDDGWAFIKCATSAPDFPVDPGKGIPDRYTGRVVSIKDSATYAINFTAGKDTYLVVAPTPGVAYFKCEVDVGEQPRAFTGVLYSTFENNFGVSQTGLQGDNRSPRPLTENYSKFRYASLAAGLYPSSNMMQFAGSVSVWKGMISLARATTSSITAATFTAPSTLDKVIEYDVSTHHLVGTTCITPAVPRSSYTESFIHGAYSVAFELGADFKWCDFAYDDAYSSAQVINSGTTESPKNSAAMDFTIPGAHLIPGWGTMETLIIKVSTPTGAVNSANLKTWNCMELQPTSSSPYDQFAHASPAYDPVALSVYSDIRNRLPVAVRAEFNESFWQRVSNLMRGLVRTVAKSSGGIGLIARGIGELVL